MKPITFYADWTPRYITKTLKQLSEAADSLGTFSGHFISWPVNPRNYRSPEWIAPLEIFEMQDEEIVLCKVIDLDFFVNLYFKRWREINSVLTFILGNKDHAEQIGKSLINVINKEIDRKATQQQLPEVFHQAVYRECRDPSLCIYSIGRDDLSEKGIKPTRVMISYGKQTPEIFVRTLQG